MAWRCLFRVVVESVCASLDVTARDRETLELSGGAQVPAHLGSGLTEPSRDLQGTQLSLHLLQSLATGVSRWALPRHHNVLSSYTPA